MAWIPITNTDWEYDDNAYNNLLENRKDFWDNQSGISISSGIRTNFDGTEIYMQVKKSGDDNPKYYESELNKTYLDNL